MKTIRVVGQRPKIRSADGSFVRVAQNNEVVGQYETTLGDDPRSRYCTIEDYMGVRHAFRVSGSVVRRIVIGDPLTYSVTEVDIPAD